MGSMEIAYLTFIFLFIFLGNRFLRGYTYENKFLSIITSKYFFAGYIGLLAVPLISPIYALALTLTAAFSFIFGHGKYFKMWPKTYDLTEREFLPADIIGDWIYAIYDKPVLANVIAMSIQGLTFAVGCGIIAIYAESFWITVIGLIAGALKGPIYWITGRIFSYTPKILLQAELAYGAVFAASIVSIIILLMRA